MISAGRGSQGATGFVELATPRVAPARRNPHPRSNEPAKASKKFQPTNHMQADLQASRLKLIDCRAVEAKLRSPLRPQPHSTTHWEPCRFVPERPLSDRCRRRCTDGCERLGLRCGQRPILARLRRADGRRYGRPGGDRRSGRWGRDFEEADAVGPLRGQPVCRGMYGRATNGSGRLLSPEEVARACGLSRRAVYRAIARGELRAARLCNRLRVQPDELERWIGERTVAPEALASTRPRLSADAAPSGSLRALLDGSEDVTDDER